MPTIDRPLSVSYVSGDVTSDGERIVLRIETAEAEPIDLAVGTDDIQHLVTLLLLLADKAATIARPPRAPEDLEAIPVPLRGLSLAESDDGQTLLALEIGGTTIAVSLPADVLVDVGRSLAGLAGAGGTAVS